MRRQSRRPAPSPSRRRASGLEPWRLLYTGASNLLMLRCAAEGRASKHAPAVRRCIGRVASFEARSGSSPGVAPQDEGLGRADGPGCRPIIMLADEVLYCRALAMPGSV